MPMRPSAQHGGRAGRWEGGSEGGRRCSVCAAALPAPRCGPRPRCHLSKRCGPQHTWPHHDLRAAAAAAKQPPHGGRRRRRRVAARGHAPLAPRAAVPLALPLLLPLHLLLPETTQKRGAHGREERAQGSVDNRGHRGGGGGGAVQGRSAGAPGAPGRCCPGPGQHPAAAKRRQLFCAVSRMHSATPAAEAGQLSARMRGPRRDFEWVHPNQHQHTTKELLTCTRKMRTGCPCLGQGPSCPRPR